jgi:hypothetical protein
VVVLTLQPAGSMLRYLALLSIGATVGCAGAEPDGRTHTSGKLSSNGLVLHAGLLRQLASQALDGSAPAADLATTDEGLELLSYVATCALADGDVLAIGGEELPGALGLAPAWLHDACDGACQKWVSACLLAHANASGVHVPIWLRADHPALGSDPDAGDGFTYQEGAFYGDLFTAGGPEMYACVGRGLIDESSDVTITQIDDADEYLHHRLCKLGGDECGFTSTGICQAMPEGPVATCDDDAGALGAFGGCHTGDWQREGQDGTPAFDEVITVYLEE